MQRAQAKQLIKWITLVWVVLSIGMVAATFGGVLPKSLFEKIFAAGFVLYAIAATLLSRFRLSE